MNASNSLVSIPLDELVTFVPTHDDIEKKDELVFFNPRFFTQDISSPNGIGFGEEDIQVLKLSIKKNGLLKPLIGRNHNQKEIQVIDGHRRLTAIKQLVASNEECFDVSTQTYAPASEVYKNLNIHTFKDINEARAFELSFDEERTKIKYGAETEINFVVHCMKKNIEDNIICNILNKSAEWLRSTKEVLNKLKDDEECMQAITNGEINKSGVMALASIEAPEERHEILHAAKKNAEKSYEKKLEKIDGDILSTKKKRIHQEAKNVINEHYGDLENIKLTNQEISELDEIIKDKEVKKASLKPRVSKKNIEAVFEELPEEKKEKIFKRAKKQPSSNHVIAEWVGYFEKLLETDGKDEDGNVVATKHFLNTCIDLLNSVDQNKGNPEIFIAAWANTKED